MTCQMCIYWKLSDNKRCPSGYGECNNSKFQAGYYSEPYHLQEYEQDGVLLENDEGWSMFTGPLFGCIHFVLKR
jgi:hypothetical protein